MNYRWFFFVENCRKLIKEVLMNAFYIEVGNRIKERRLGLKLTRDKLAHMAGISDKFLYEIEVGNKGMSARTLYKLALALEVSADWLLKGTDMEQ